MGNNRFQPKSKKKVSVNRKQIRKEKRQQKKTSRSSYYQKSKEFYQKIKKIKKNDPQPVKVQEDSDEDIPSDFESDTEVKLAPPQVSQIEQDRLAEMAEREEYENELKRKRIDQLVEQNADEEKVIRKYEKLLKLNKRKGKKELSFDDGLDYALELCTPESIQKMYAAAKDVAANEEESADEFKEDFEMATGKKLSKQKLTSANKKKSLMTNEMKKAKDKKHIHKLKAIEQKYFGDEIDLDGCDSLAGSDSELDEDQSATEDEVNIAQSDEDSDSNDEDVVEEPIKKASSKNKTIKFQVVKEPPAKKKKNFESDSENSDYDDPLESDNGSEESGGENMDEQSDGEASKDSDSDPEAKAVWQKLKNRNSKGNTKKPADTLESQIDEDSDDEANTVWEQLKNRKKNKTSETGGKSNSWEDIYGRKRDKEGNILEENTKGKYVPPHVRARLEAENPNDPKRQEKMLRLKKQLKGQLNRLSETNLLRIANDIDALYMNNARFDMNNTLTALILEAVVAPTLSPDRMVLEHTLLVALLHANVGSEVGAHFLQILVEKFNEKSKELAHQNVENKELDNIILILCHLYTFQVFHHSLIYEFLNRLSNTWSEKSVECILLALRAIGFILRKDNALNLKEFILKIQQLAAKAPEEHKNE
jgi:nucleolar MIF4G domain-containing protein 1